MYLIGVPEGKERNGQMQGEMVTEKLPDMTKGIQEFQRWDFSGCPVVKACLPMQGIRVLSLVRELGSHVPSSVAKKKRGGMFLTIQLVHFQILNDAHPNPAY